MDAQRLHDQTGLEHIPLIQKPYTAEKLLTTLHSVLADAA
jgi:hypothetical protein